MTKSELRYYVDRRKEGWDNSKIREELIKKGFPKDRITEYVDDIDDCFYFTFRKKSSCICFSNFIQYFKTSCKT